MKRHRESSVRSGDRFFYIICYILVGVLALLVLYPIVYVISASFSSGDAIATGKVWLWPVDFSLDGYKAVFQWKSIWIGYRNTIFYTVVGTFINVCLTMSCAYPLARKNLRGRKVIMRMFTFSMIFSGGMISKYILMMKLNLLDSVLAMLLPCALNTYNMIVARTFIQNSIPGELLEAAKIDGCSDIRFFFDIVLPLSKPIIAVLTLWYAVAHWNSYFDAFLYLSDKDLYPLQIFLKELLVQSSISADLSSGMPADAAQNTYLVLKYATIVVSTVPLFLIYPFVQKHFAKGVMVGSIKG